jgi:hypothetical protein
MPAQAPEAQESSVEETQMKLETERQHCAQQSSQPDVAKGLPVANDPHDVWHQGTEHKATQ